MVQTLVNNTLQYNDQLTCLQGGILTRQQQKPVAVTVYPNPAANAATVSSQLPEEAIGKLVLYNTLGQQVSQAALSGNATKTEFSTASLAEGMYYYSVYSGSEVMGTGKLSIVR